MESRLRILFEKYFHKTASPDEEREFFALLQQDELQEPLENLLKKAYLNYENSDPFFDVEQTDRMLKQIKGRSIGNARRGWYQIARYAAVILFGFGLGFFIYYYWSKPIDKPSAQQKTMVKRDVVPAKERATITLADGRIVAVEEMANGLFNDQGNTFLKEPQGLLDYSTNENTAKDIAFHTIHIPKGGQYRLILADGTKVWLNAASSLQYPTRFDGTVREVSVSGEAYFEVAHQAERPFLVHCKGQRIQVLGTHFNVRAYMDEPELKTTLLEGSVVVTKQDRPAEGVRLKPGEEASLAAEGNIKVTPLKDASLRIGWTKGYFMFDRADLKTVLRELSRWYDVDFKVKSNTTKTYTGKIDRQLSLSELMNGLSLSGIPIQIEDQDHIIELPTDL